MKNCKLLLTSLLIWFFLTSIFAQENQKLAQTGMKFLSVSTDAKISAIGEANTSLFGHSESMLYNPAGMAEQENLVDISFGQTSWIADINYLHATISFQPFDFDYGVFGISVVAVDYGELQGTIRADNELGYLDIGTFSPKAIAVGIGYAKMLSEKFGFGANIKYVNQALASGIVGFAQNNGNYVYDDFQKGVFAFDFGMLYKTGFKSLNIGMSIRNFSPEIKYIEESFQLPLNFKIGASIDAMDLVEADKDVHSLVVSVDAAHPRDFAEQVMVGANYTFMNTFSVRAGYITPQDVRGFNAGVGIMQNLSGVMLSVDYAYSPFDVFDDVHRISLRIGY